jgi:glutathione synthase
VIGGLLTEVNVTSPGGLRTIDAVAGTRLAATILDWLEARCTPLAIAA